VLKQKKLDGKLSALYHSREKPLSAEEFYTRLKKHGYVQQQYADILKNQQPAAPEKLLESRWAYLRLTLHKTPRP
jgi:hypothetical protein